MESDFLNCTLMRMWNHFSCETMKFERWKLDIHAWHIQYCSCTTYTALTCELYELQAITTRRIVVNIRGPVCTWNWLVWNTPIYVFHTRHFTCSQCLVYFTCAALDIFLRVSETNRILFHPSSKTSSFITLILHVMKRSAFFSTSLNLLRKFSGNALKLLAFESASMIYLEENKF